MSDRDTSRPIVIAFEMPPAGFDAFSAAIGDTAPIVSLTELDSTAREAALSRAVAIMSRNPSRDLRPEELPLIKDARLLQCFSSGVDFIPFDGIPPSVPIACNAGAFAEPMAEHGLAMICAAYKRLFVEHELLKAGHFNQFERNKSIAGSTLGVLGFGAIGAATARLMTALGARVVAVNRRGIADSPVDFIGTIADLDYILEQSDALLISAPYTTETENIIGARELARMKPDAAIVNLARGELIDERALYEHLVANPTFTACIDAWWIEPVRHGEFKMSFPFLDLPNVIASPHNSASVTRAGSPPHRLAGENCRRAALGEPPLNIVDRTLSPLGQ